MNPFKYGTTVTDEYFCRRLELEKMISRHVRANQNIHVEGDRRTGKTSLILHVSESLKKRLLLHFDFQLVKCIEDIRGRLVDGLSKVSVRVGMFEKLTRALAHLRPVVSVNPSTGEPTLSISPTRESALTGKSLVEILEFIQVNFATKKPIIFFDEFQDVLKTPDADEILAMLRSSIQLHHDCAYIYSGSSRSEMDSIFRYPDSPFYKSAIPVPVGTIDRNDFVPFLIRKFELGRRIVNNDIFNAILDMVADNPGDVQEVCNCLWDVTNKGQELSQDNVETALQLIFDRESKYFEQVIDSITPVQKKCLHGLAALDGRGIYSNQFAEITGVRNTGSITKALKQLEKKRIIHSIGKKFLFASPFLKLWLPRNPNL